MAEVNNKNTRSRYQEKLLDQRWQQRKTSIQIRDQFTCQKCKVKDQTVHVHHRHYLAGRDQRKQPQKLLKRWHRRYITMDISIPK